MTEGVRLDGWWWAMDEDDCRRQVEAWLAAEANVLAGRIVAMEPLDTLSPYSAARWDVTVDVTLRDRAASQPTLWEAA